MNEQEKTALAKKVEGLDYVYGATWDYSDESPYVVFWNADTEMQWCILFCPTQDEKYFALAHTKATKTIDEAVEHIKSIDGKYGLTPDDAAGWYSLYLSDEKGMMIELDIMTGKPPTPTLP